ncbi:MAG: thiamine-phosphate kinase, partial [Thalassotalea sp.]|nr:thiamine-phosphate kinase [Thalassotalea sp.]
HVNQRLNYPKPRVLAGQALREYASSAIDLSDGLLSDLEHIRKASNIGVNIVLEDLPISNVLYDALGQQAAIELALKGGDDYELLFTVSADHKVGMETALANVGVTVTCIGQLNATGKITTTLNSQVTNINVQGFEHFSKEEE